MQNRTTKPSDPQSKARFTGEAVESRSFASVESTTINVSNIFLARVTKNLQSGHHPEIKERHKMDMVRRSFRARVTE
jgi:hypothetical protein